MEYKDFIHNIKNGIQKIIGNKGKAEIIQVNRNNGIKLDGLIVMDSEKNISPTIYLDIYYEQFREGRTETDILNEIHQLYQKYSCGMEMDINIQDLQSYEKIKKNIAYKVINYEKNYELLQEIPHVRFLDMAIVFFVLVPCNNNHSLENAVFQIRDEHLKMWNTDIGEVYRDALYNTPELFPPKIHCMTDVLTELISKENKQDVHIQEECNFWHQEIENMKTKEYPCLYVFTNDRNANGAACLLYKNTLKEFSEKENTDFYIIPSSVHEVLLISAENNNISVGDLRKIVEEVNRTELSEEEILSDNIYYYHYQTDSFRII